jgi:hypothetical protein
MSSLLKSGIDDPGLWFCEYQNRITSVTRRTFISVLEPYMLVSIAARCVKLVKAAC